MNYKPCDLQLTISMLCKAIVNFEVNQTQGSFSKSENILSVANLENIEHGYVHIQDISKNFEFEKGSRDCNKK